eukprot:gene32743-42399_t
MEIWQKESNRDAQLQRERSLWQSQLKQRHDSQEQERH